MISLFPDRRRHSSTPEDQSIPSAAGWDNDEAEHKSDSIRNPNSKIKPLLSTLVPRLAASFIKIVSFTMRVSRTQEGAYPDPKDSMILAIWHGDQIVTAAFWLWNSRRREPRSILSPLSALISRHRDGRLAAAIVNHLGIRDIPGSSSSGGARALIAMVRALHAGTSVTITVDGPRGPIEAAKGGVISLAQHSGRLIYPIAIETHHGIRLRSWDKMQVPLPWSKLRVISGPPIQVSKNLSAEQFEAHRAHLEAELKRLHALARSYPSPNKK